MIQQTQLPLLMIEDLMQLMSVQLLSPELLKRVESFVKNIALDLELRSLQSAVFHLQATHPGLATLSYRKYPSIEPKKPAPPRLSKLHFLPATDYMLSDRPS